MADMKIYYDLHYRLVGLETHEFPALYLKMTLTSSPKGTRADG